MVFRPEANQGRRAFPSRNKVIPYLTVHCRRTEKFSGSGDTLTATTTSTFTDTCTACIYATYDSYCKGTSGGPALTYWWKMGPVPCGWDAGWTATLSVTLSNYGTATPSKFYGIVNNDDVTHIAGLALNTCDNLCATPRNISGTNVNIILYARNVLLDGTQPFTAGLWFNSTSHQADRDLLFQSNLGGNIGTYRGVWVDLDGTSVRVTFGNNLGAVGSDRNSFQTGSVVAIGVTHFIAIYVDGDADISGTAGSYTFKLYVDGHQVPCPYVGGGGTGFITFPTNVNSRGENGVGFPGDLKNYVPIVDYDECFVHMGEITAAQILRMWELGTTP